MTVKQFFVTFSVTQIFRSFFASAYCTLLFFGASFTAAQHFLIRVEKTISEINVPLSGCKCKKSPFDCPSLHPEDALWATVTWASDCFATISFNYAAIAASLMMSQSANIGSVRLETDINTLHRTVLGSIFPNWCSLCCFGAAAASSSGNESFSS